METQEDKIQIANKNISETIAEKEYRKLMEKFKKTIQKKDIIREEYITK